MGKITKLTLANNTLDLTEIIKRLGVLEKRNGIFTPTETTGGKIYGFKIDSLSSDPYNSVTYIADAVGMKPAKMDFQNGVFDYGSWSGAFFLPRPCMLKYDGTVDYYLDPDDYTKKEDGTPSDVNNINYKGNAMMEWGRDGKQIWYKIVDKGDGNGEFYITDHKEDANYVCYSFVNRDNAVQDHFYTAIYHGSLDGNGRLRSISNQTTAVSISATNSLAAARKDGVRYCIDTYSDRVLINILTVLMFKNLNIQVALGTGRVEGGSSSNIEKTGTKDTKGMFFGDTINSQSKLFGMESWYGEACRWCAGLISKDKTYLVKMTPGVYDGTTVTDYNDDGTGYKNYGAIPDKGSSYTSKMKFPDNTMLPLEINGSDSTYYSDYFYVHSGTNFSRFGGYSYGSSDPGLFCLFLSDLASDLGWNRGCALSYR